MARRENRDTLRAVGRALFLATLAVAGLPTGCSSRSAEVGLALTLLADTSVSDDALGRVVRFEFTASGDEVYTQTTSLTRPALRSERILYVPRPATRQLSLSVQARGADGALIASGVSENLTLAAGESRAIELKLFAPSQPDGGGDGSLPADLGGADQGGGTCPVGAFCETFEAGIDPTVWKSTGVGSGTMSLDPMRAHRGMQSLHAHFPANAVAGNQVVALEQKDVSALDGWSDIWARLYLYVPSPVPPNYMHLFETSQSSGNFDVLSIAVKTSGVLALEDFSNGSTITSAMLPLDRWTCLEWHTVVAASGSMSLAVDGVDVPETHTSNILGPPGPSYFIIRAARYGTDSIDATPRDIWYDDLIISKTRVGCAP